jgi:hypothetical protein
VIDAFPKIASVVDGDSEIHRESFAVDRVRDPSLTESPRSQKETNTRAGSETIRR